MASVSMISAPDARSGRRWFDATQLSLLLSWDLGMAGLLATALAGNRRTVIKLELKGIASRLLGT